MITGLNAGRIGNARRIYSAGILLQWADRQQRGELLWRVQDGGRAVRPQEGFVAEAPGDADTVHACSPGCGDVHIGVTHIEGTVRSQQCAP